MIVGACKKCGGRVSQDTERNYHCNKCGAYFKNNIPFTPMEPNPYHNPWRNPSDLTLYCSIIGNALSR